jgi:two-component system, NarL family, response regulator
VGTHTPTETITVVIVDDHPLASTGIARVLKGERDMDVAAVCYGEAEAVNAALKHEPAVVVFEFPNARPGSQALLRSVALAHPRARLIVVGPHTSEIDRFRDAGASGFLITGQARQFLAASIRNVLAGATWIEYTGRVRRVSTPPGGQYIVGG